MPFKPVTATRQVRLARLGMKRALTPLDDRQISDMLRTSKAWKDATVMLDRLGRSTVDRSTRADKRAFWAVAWCDDATALAISMLAEFAAPEIRTRAREALLVRSSEIRRDPSDAIVARQAAVKAALGKLNKFMPTKMWSPAWQALVTASIDPQFVAVLDRYVSDRAESVEIALDVRHRAMEIGAYELLIGLCKSSPASPAELWELTVALNAAV